ncbi:MAG TPA: hypothetical protein VII42_09665 [Caulobacteraceae bacterium]
MSVGFTPAGDWFVFDDNGRTLKRGFRRKIDALAWIARSRRPDKRKA